MKSRKTIVAIIAVLVAVLGFIKADFALVGDPGEAVGAIGIAMLYIFFQAKTDLAGFKDQIAKLKDPKFWVAIIGVIVAPLNANLGWNLPVELIQGFAAVVIPAIFGLIWKTKIAPARPA